MGVNGGNTDKKWQKEILVLERIIDAPWQLVAQLGNKYDCLFQEQYLII